MRDGGGGVKVPSIDLCSLLQRIRAIRERVVKIP